MGLFWHFRFMRGEPNKGVVTGWGEMLWRVKPVDLVTLESELVSRDYEWENYFPLAEFNGPYDFVELFRTPERARKSNGRREMRRYDMINLCTKTPVQGVTSFLVIDPLKDRHLRYPGGRIIISESGLGLGIIRLRNPMPSFAAR